MIHINRHPSSRELRQFAAIWWPLAMAVVASWIHAGTGSARAAAGLVGGALAVSVFGLIRPAFMRRIYVGWMVAAAPIGWVVSHLVLAFVFFAVMTPIGLIMRALGRDPLERRFDPQAPTYWKPHAGSEVSRYFRQF